MGPTALPTTLVPVSQTGPNRPYKGTYSSTIAILGDATAGNDLLISQGQVQATISDQSISTSPVNFSVDTNQGTQVGVATYNPA
jgi:hypothetical protein